ncbi:P-loop containing nucleoside triphosphate hydrolase protein [Baffinella frigidus]|nr:P-loop containing nucleoside triphosphate hydrolase protein [Cryptophyta sp. CCMP2293]
MFRPDFAFSKMGIGGLDTELGDIFRRAFASRVYPSSVLAKMGLMHVRGVLLFGAPGCGKTLIARKIGKMLRSLTSRTFSQVVNGPEIFSKYVGGSEENIRNLFADAKAEMEEKGDESELHVIILDEVDAICRQRGTTRGDTGVGDSVVNQLLSFIDGVDALNNILIIGMTNRKDMLDEALLRPGRLEVHVEIGLPNEAGRVQILSIHTTGMKEHGFLDAAVDVDQLAKITKNYTGAEIEGVCKAAASYAFERNIDTANIDKEHSDTSNIKVYMEDFTRAINEIKPAFGMSLDAIEQSMPNGILQYGPRFTQMVETGTKFISQVRDSARTPLVSLLIEGAPGAGKTSLSAYLALQAEFPYIKFISAENLVNQSESARAFKLTQAFEDAYRSPVSVVLLDNIERLVSYVKIGPRFSNDMLQILLVLIQKAPPKGHRLLVIGTTSNMAVLEALELAGPQGVFNSTISVPLLNQDEASEVPPPPPPC